MMPDLGPGRTPFPVLGAQDAAWLRESSCRKVYDYGEDIDLPRREEGGICVVREGRIRLILDAKGDWQLTVGFLEAGEAFELHWVEGPVEGELYARAAADRTVVEGMPWAALVRVASSAQVARLDRQLYQAWRCQRELIAMIADVIQKWGNRSRR
jgi:hypothetical protein